MLSVQYASYIFKYTHIKYTPRADQLKTSINTLADNEPLVEPV